MVRGEIEVVGRSEKAPPFAKFKQGKIKKRPAKTFPDGTKMEAEYQPAALPDVTDECREAYLATVCQSTGTLHDVLGVALLEQARKATPSGREIDVIANAVAAALAELKPIDPVEGFLVTQIVALHNQMMHYMQKSLDEKDNNYFVDVNISRFTKINRCFVSTLESLMKYRLMQKGGPSIQVMNVNNGAIIGFQNNEK